MTAAAIVALVPVLRRPARAAPLVESFAAATPPPYRVVFVCSPGDQAEIEAVRATDATLIVAPFEVGPGDWARKVNLGYRSTSEPLMLLCGDDIAPRPGWADEVRRAAALGWGVIGTNDLGNPQVMAGATSTHPVVARWYADEHGTVDGPGMVVSEAYAHNFVDDELVETAKARGLWAFCNTAILEHHHPNWGKGEMDWVYALGREGFESDRWQNELRSRLWRSLSPLPRTAAPAG